QGRAHGESQTGAFTGSLRDSRLIDIVAGGDATTTVNYATGGIVGVAVAGSVVRRAVSFGTVQGVNHLSGGIAGISYDLLIRDSYSVGDVKAMLSTVGGLIGAHYGSRVVDSFSYSKVT